VGFAVLFSKHYRQSTKDRVRTLEAQVAALSELLRSVTLETLLFS
jgi:hypothetical protein